ASEEDRRPRWRVGLRARQEGKHPAKERDGRVGLERFVRQGEFPDHVHLVKGGRQRELAARIVRGLPAAPVVPRPEDTQVRWYHSAALLEISRPEPAADVARFH